MKRSFRMRWWKDVQKWEKCCWFPKLPIEVENRKRWASWREPPIKIRRRLNGFLCSYATRNAIMVRIHTTTLLKRWAATGRVQLDSEKLAAKVRGERITKKSSRNTFEPTLSYLRKNPQTEGTTLNWFLCSHSARNATMHVSMWCYAIM